MNLKVESPGGQRCKFIRNLLTFSTSTNLFMLVKLKADAIDSRILKRGCIHAAKVYIEYKGTRGTQADLSGAEY